MPSMCVSRRAFGRHLARFALTLSFRQNLGGTHFAPPPSQWCSAEIAVNAGLKVPPTRLSHSDLAPRAVFRASVPPFTGADRSGVDGGNGTGLPRSLSPTLSLVLPNSPRTGRAGARYRIQQRISFMAFFRGRPLMWRKSRLGVNGEDCKSC